MTDSFESTRTKLEKYKNKILSSELSHPSYLLYHQKYKYYTDLLGGKSKAEKKAIEDRQAESSRRCLSSNCAVFLNKIAKFDPANKALILNKENIKSREYHSHVIKLYEYLQNELNRLVQQIPKTDKIELLGSKKRHIK